MGSEGSNPAAFPCAGERVEVIDRRHKLFGRVGTIAYFVGDNVYVTFTQLRWSKTRMLFADQLSAVHVREECEPRPAAAADESSLVPPRVASAHAPIDVNPGRDR
jgi:hypothetical protein